MAADKKKSNDGTYVFGKTSLDVEALRQIVEIVESSEVTRLVWSNGDEKLIIRRGNPVTHVVHSGPHAPAPSSVHVMPSAPTAASEAPRPSIGNRPTAPASPA